MDIAEFLTARYDEDEAEAQWSGPDCIAWLTYRRDDGQMLYTTVAAGNGAEGPWVADGRELPDPASARIAYDPSRVLADIAAKRRILARHADPEHYCDDSSQVRYTRYVACEAVPSVQPCDTLSDLAAPYAEHPDYDPAWAVDAAD